MILRKIRTFLRDIRVFSVKLVSYIPLLWRDRDWDWIFIMLLLQYKIKRTRQTIRANSFIEEAELAGIEEQMHFAEFLIDKISESYLEEREQFYWDTLTSHINKNIRNWWD